MAQAAHIRVAQTEGAKAGFNAYLETLRRSGLPTVQEKLHEIESQGNKKAQFDFYCSQFGSKFGNTQDDVDNSLDDVEDTNGTSEVDDLLATIEALKERVAHLSDAPAPRTTRSSGGSQSTSSNKPATFKAGAIRVKQIPTKVGATFTYKGKTRSTKMRVVSVSGSGANQVVVAERI